MSSKKQRRKQRQQEEEERPRRKANPAVLFIVGIGAVVVLMLVGVLVFGEGGGPGEPPWPGAVWSSAHGHWH